MGLGMGCLPRDIGAGEALQEAEAQQREEGFTEAAETLRSAALPHRGHPHAEQLMWQAASLSWQGLLASQARPDGGRWSGTLQRWERTCADWPVTSDLMLELGSGVIQLEMDHLREAIALRANGARSEGTIIVEREGRTCGRLSVQVTEASDPDDGGAPLEAWVGYQVVTRESASTQCPPLCSWAGVAQLQPLL